MADLTQPATGEPITLGPGEQLQRICWHGAPVLVVTATRAHEMPLEHLPRSGEHSWT